MSTNTQPPQPPQHCGVLTACTGYDESCFCSCWACTALCAAYDDNLSIGDEILDTPPDTSNEEPAQGLFEEGLSEADPDEPAVSIAQKFVPREMKCSECDATRPVSDLFNENGQGWIRNVIPRPDGRDYPRLYEYFCPEHAVGKCLHGITATKSTQRRFLGLADSSLTIETADGRPTVVCTQCRSVWVCTPADVLLSDQLPRDVIVDMITEGRWEEAVAMFHELAAFTAAETNRQRLDLNTTRLLWLATDPARLHAVAGAMAAGEKLGAAVDRLAAAAASSEEQVVETSQDFIQVIEPS